MATPEGDTPTGKIDITSEAEWDVIATEAGRLRMAVDTGLLELIHPGNFPHLSARVVWIADFWARDNGIDSLGNIRAVTQKPQARRGLGILMTELIEERDTALLANLPADGEVDEEAIRRQAFSVRQGPEQTALMQLAIGAGLLESLDSRKFPFLGGLTAREFAQLRWVAGVHRKELYQQMEGERKTGFRSGQGARAGVATGEVGLRDQLADLNAYLRKTARDAGG